MNQFIVPSAVVSLLGKNPGSLLKGVIPYLFEYV